MLWNEFVNECGEAIAASIVQPLAFLNDELRNNAYHNVGIKPEDDRNAQITKLCVWLNNHSSQIQQTQFENYARRFKPVSERAKADIIIKPSHRVMLDKVADAALEVLKKEATQPFFRHP